MMQLELLKKMNNRVFVARCVHSHAVLRFEAEAVPDIPVGEYCHVTDCAFDQKSKLVKCVIPDQSANRQKGERGADGERRADGPGEQQSAGVSVRVCKRRRPDLTK